MKNLQTFDEFLNEKAYLLTGGFGAKGIPGKVLFAFKKQIERIRFEKTGQDLLDEINKTWSKWAPKEGAKIIETEVLKAVKDRDAIVYLTAKLNTMWKFDTVNDINSLDIEKDKKAYITLDTTDFVIKKETTPLIKIETKIKIKISIEIFPKSSFIAAAAPVLVLEIA